MHNDCSHIEDVHLLFRAHLIIIILYYIFRIVELTLLLLHHLWSTYTVKSVTPIVFIPFYSNLAYTGSWYIEDVHHLFCAVDLDLNCFQNRIYPGLMYDKDQASLFSSLLMFYRLYWLQRQPVFDCCQIKVCCPRPVHLECYYRLVWRIYWGSVHL